MLIPFQYITKKYHMKIDGILHIGAHDCEELPAYNKYGLNNNKIIWVEANPKIAERNIKKDNTRIIKNFICCDKDEGTTTLNIANNGQSSSIFEFGSHALQHPHVKYNGTVEVKNNRIDTMYKDDNIPNNFANFVTLDIQGAELLALKGMGELLNNFDYIFTEVNRDHLYKDCCLVNELDEYLSKYKFKRVETKWTQHNWGDALYVKIKSDLKILENVRCTKELWQIKGITLEQALQKAKNDQRVTALHWYKQNKHVTNNYGDGRLGGIRGWYQGACGDIGTVSNNDWDTIPLYNKSNITLINNEMFYCKQHIVYPPFKNGLYLEEYFLNYIRENDNIITTRKYIPVLWTNLHLNENFKRNKNMLQKILDNWVKCNPSVFGYYTICQHADGPLLKLPKDTIVYGGSVGDLPLPLIYEDKNNTLDNVPKLSFNDKNILCSFVGRIATSHSINPDVRKLMSNTYKKNSKFKLIDTGGQQGTFKNITSQSKFAFAPRGYGRSSFRFFECFQLRTIPIYIWSDKNWLPFQDKIDYNKLCIVIHVSDIDKIENMLLNITEEQYNSMWEYYEEIKHFFTLEGMSKEIISSLDIKISLCIPTMDRYDIFLSKYLPLYLKNNLIDEIIISDENGNDIQKIKDNFQDLSKFKFNINEKRKGAFLNKITSCKLASNEWIVLMDSDNYADFDYFKTVINFISDNKDLKKNTILSPCFAQPNFNYRHFSEKCITRDNLSIIKQETKDMSPPLETLMNTGNYVLNKYLIDNLKLQDEDMLLIKQSNACDVILMNTLFFEQLDLEMYVIPKLHYKHVVHDGSIYLKECKNTKNTIDLVNQRYRELYKDSNKKLEILLKTNYFETNKNRSFIKNGIIIGIPPKNKEYFNFERQNNCKLKKFNKIFCIGLNKTGTSSLHYAFKELGLTSFHGGTYDERIDCFSDGRYYKYFKELDEINPNSKFILNTRNLENWIISRIKHCKSSGYIPDWEQDCRYDDTRIKEWKNQREQLHTEIKEYFKNRPKDLLIFDVCGGDGYDKLCNFLELPVINQNFPHKNKSK